MSNIVNYEWKDIEEMQNVQKYFGIEDEMFAKGYMFAQYVIDGSSMGKAYRLAFDVEQKLASSRAGGFMNRKWVKELVRSLKVDDDTLYIGEIKKIIARGMEIVNDTRSAPRDVTEAMRALQPYLKQVVQKQEIEHKLVMEQTPADIMMDKMQEGIKQISGAGKMINENQEIIDVAEVI